MERSHRETVEKAPESGSPGNEDSRASHSDGPSRARGPATRTQRKAEGGERSRRYSQISERNRCRFCREKTTRVDYKDVLTLQKLCTSQGRIFSRKRSGNCAAHQRQVKQAIKQARYIGLLSYTV
jgi:small subunit ribosomal protein S18